MICEYIEKELDNKNYQLVLDWVKHQREIPTYNFEKVYPSKYVDLMESKANIQEERDKKLTEILK